jgi:hypothetical protein
MGDSTEARDYRRDNKQRLNRAFSADEICFDSGPGALPQAGNERRAFGAEDVRRGNMSEHSSGAMTLCTPL